MALCQDKLLSWPGLKKLSSCAIFRFFAGCFRCAANSATGCSKATGSSRSGRRGN